MTVRAIGTWNCFFTQNGSGSESPAGEAVLEDFPVELDDVNPYGVAFLLLPDGTSPPSTPVNGGTQVTAAAFGFPYVSHTTSTDISRTLTQSEIFTLGGGANNYRVWIICNDDDVSDNTGSIEFEINITR